MSGEAPATSSRATASSLAFVAGCVDTAGFIALFGLFTAHVTGNFVVIGASLVESRRGLLMKLLALPVFIAVVALVRLLVRARERRGRPTGAFLLWLEAGLLALCLAAGIAATPLSDGDAPAALPAGWIGVAAMAVQNAAARLAFKELTPTTVMTGNTTQAVIDAVDLIGGSAGEGVARRFAQLWPPIVAFAAGAAAGALGYRFGGFTVLVLPILVLVVIASRHGDR